MKIAAIPIISTTKLRNVVIILAMLCIGLMFWHIWLFGLHIDWANAFGLHAGFEYRSYAYSIRGIAPPSLADERLVATVFVVFLFGLYIAFAWKLFSRRILSALLLIIPIYSIIRILPLFTGELAAVHDNILKMYTDIKTGKEHSVRLIESISPSTGSHLYFFAPASWSGGESPCTPFVFYGSEIFSADGRASEWIKAEELRKIPAFSDLISRDYQRGLEYANGMVNARAHNVGNSIIYTLIYCFAPSFW